MNKQHPKTLEPEFLDSVATQRANFPWGPKDSGGSLVSLFLTVERLLSEKNDMNSALDTLLYHLKKELGVIKGMICLFHSDSSKIFVSRSSGFSREEEENLHTVIYDLLDFSRPRRAGAPLGPLNLRRTWGGHSRQASPLAGDPELTLTYVPIIRNNTVLGAIYTLSRFQNKNSKKSQETYLSILASLFSSPAKLYMLLTIDKIALEKKVRTLTGEIYELKERYSPSNLVSCSNAMQEVYFLLRKVASLKTVVLLLGEKGVEKETVAQSLHYDGLKTMGPFLKLNCSLYPPEELEVLLFGEESSIIGEKSNSNPGLLESAESGSLFIDDVDKLPLRAQAKLLEALKDRTFEKAPGTGSIPMNARLIVGTSVDLATMVNHGLFIENLYYRLNVFPITIPPLREREEDIVRLSRHFLTRFSEELNKNITSFSPQALDILRSYAWPLNVSELENVIRQTVIIAEDNAKTIEPHDLPTHIRLSTTHRANPRLGLVERMDSLERDLIAEALRHHRGNISRAAKDLELTRRSMGLRMKRLNLNYKDFRV